MTMKKWILSISVVLILLIAFVVVQQLFRPVPERVFDRPLTLVAPNEMATFTDDGHGDLFTETIQRQIAALSLREMDEPVQWGDQTVSRKRLLRTLELFQQLHTDMDAESLWARIPEVLCPFGHSLWAMRERLTVGSHCSFPPVWD